MDYPHAERLDLVEDLHGHRVADPYRWLEDADDPRTKEWSAAQDELFARHRDGFGAGPRPLPATGSTAWPGPASCHDAGLARRAPVLHAPRSRARSTPCSTPSTPTAPSASSSTRWRSTRTARPRWTPGSPRCEGDRLAYGISAGGTEESVAVRARRRDGRA